LHLAVAHGSAARVEQADGRVRLAVLLDAPRRARQKVVRSLCGIHFGSIPACTYVTGIILRGQGGSRLWESSTLQML